MNYKIALSAAFAATVGITGCDSNDRAYDSDVRSGATSETLNTNRNLDGQTADAPVEVSGDHSSANTNHEIDHDRDVKAQSGTTQPASSQPVEDQADDTNAVSDNNADLSSGTTVEPSSESVDSDDNLLPGAGEISSDETSESQNPGVVADQNDVYHSNGDEEDVSSGTTYDANPQVSYSQTEHPGGIAPEDRNLRYGLMGNGTGLGLEDTTSKFMTDNDTLADPKIDNSWAHSRGALSAPTTDQDALQDIKSGTSFDYYDIED